ncbi:redoxin domain-containing protein [Salinibacillus xinjiangensis]|uniref:Redoxin domain-containing protein n=2 Tax=Salinibacillus xinjiangensis TaxID=1229268 RepID=A0A6G1X3X0_9BACI|nr:redoxin domain-containing protein [Salinibacillus xinjiangensis]
MIKPIGAILLALLVLNACGGNEENNESNTAADQNQNAQPSASQDINFEIEDFTYTNQDKEKVSLEDLKGTYWVADFIFTSCETACLTMSPNMARMQQQLKDEEMEDVHLISFSADPNVDTPEVLKEYGKKYGADFSKWDFLTGYSQKEIEKFAADSFKTLVSKVEGEDQVAHGTSFYLINPEGQAIKKYPGLKASSSQSIIEDIKKLENQ